MSSSMRTENTILAAAEPVSPPPIMYVRALYDYQAPDANNLSFSAGEVISVLNQSPSGWWDGKKGDVRGWFPSNFCEEYYEDELYDPIEYHLHPGDEAEISNIGMNLGSTYHKSDLNDSSSMRLANDSTNDPTYNDNYNRPDFSPQPSFHTAANSIDRSNNDNDPDQSYWMPQWSPDGRLYYFNSATGLNTNEDPTSPRSTTYAESSDSSFRDLRSSTYTITNNSSMESYTITNNSSLESVRYSPHFDTTTLCNDSDNDHSCTFPKSSAITSEPAPTSTGSHEELPPQATSDAQAGDHVENQSEREGVAELPASPSRQDPNNAPSEPSSTASQQASLASSCKTLNNEHLPRKKYTTAKIPTNEFLDDGTGSHTRTWALLLTDTRQAIDSYRRVIHSRLRSEYVYRVEDISDHIRHLLAAASSTTDNHSGTPSIISGNRMLSEAFKLMMSHFSKLVINSHLASVEWVTMEAKCLEELDELWEAVNRFVLTARQLRVDEAIDRLTPGFVAQNIAGGNWTMNGVLAGLHKLRTPPDGEDDGDDDYSDEEDDDYFDDIEGDGDTGPYDGTKYSLQVDENRATVFPSEDVSVGLEALRGDLEEALSTLFQSLVIIPVILPDGKKTRKISNRSTQERLATVACQNAGVVLQKFKLLASSIESLNLFIFGNEPPAHPPPPPTAASSSASSMRAKSVLSPPPSSMSTRNSKSNSVTSNPAGPNNSDPFTFNNFQANNPSLTDIFVYKQRLYDGVGALVVACQALAAPLGDEWHLSMDNNIRRRSSTAKLETLETRVGAARTAVSQMKATLEQFDMALSMLVEMNGGLKGITSRPLVHALSRYKSGPSRGRRPGKRKQSKGSLDKAHRFFGEKAPHSAPDPSPRLPWFLKLDHEEEINLDKKTDPPTVKSGTLRALVSQLTRHDKLNPTFNATFLITYRSFTTARELFELLLERFNMQPPEGLDDHLELRIWADQKRTPVRLRVMNTLKIWLDSNWMEPKDEESERVLGDIMAFAKEQDALKTPGANQLFLLVGQRLQNHTAKILHITAPKNLPPPIIPKGWRTAKKARFLDWDPMELARQLTLIEYELFSVLQPNDCLNKAQGKPTPNLTALSKHSNQLANWAAEMILSQSDLKQRAAFVKHFILIADKCLQLNNYSTVFSIVNGAFGCSEVHRLQRTWAQIGSKTTNILQNMKHITNHTRNFGEYRDRLRGTIPPCIPFLGIYLTDLTFIQDGIGAVTSANLINFSKRVKAAEVIQEIEQFRSTPYFYQTVEDLKDKLLAEMRKAKSSDDLYPRSLELEPRVTVNDDTDKITRLVRSSLHFSTEQ